MRLDRPFEKDGRIVREEQVSNYPQISPDIPDANPRGCNKGALHSQSLYEKDRIPYPMKRIGSRGEGKWKRISWDEATEEIAERIVELENKKEFNKLMVYAGTGILSPVRRAASLRLGLFLALFVLMLQALLAICFPAQQLPMASPQWAAPQRHGTRLTISSSGG